MSLRVSRALLKNHSRSLMIFPPTWTFRSKRVEKGATETDFVAAARADLPAEEADAYDRAMPFWQSYAGLRRYWDTRE